MVKADNGRKGFSGQQHHGAGKGNADGFALCQPQDVRLLLDGPVAVAGAETPLHGKPLSLHFIFDVFFHGIGCLLHGSSGGGIKKHRKAVSALCKGFCYLIFNSLAYSGGYDSGLAAALQVPAYAGAL